MALLGTTFDFCSTTSTVGVPASTTRSQNCHPNFSTKCITPRTVDMSLFRILVPQWWGQGDHFSNGLQSLEEDPFAKDTLKAQPLHQTSPTTHCSLLITPPTPSFRLLEQPWFPETWPVETGRIQPLSHGYWEAQLWAAGQEGVACFRGGQPPADQPKFIECLLTPGLLKFFFDDAI